MKNLLSVLCILALTGNVYAQKKKTTATTPATKASAPTPAMKSGVTPGFSVTETGLEYQIIKNAKAGTQPKVGDYVELHILTKGGDSVLFESRRVNENKPVSIQLAPASFKGDLVEGIMMMTPGDSAVFNMSVDSLIKAGIPSQAWMKEGTNQKLTYYVSLVSVKTADAVKKEQDAKSAQQVGIDDQLLQDYFKANNIKATRTASGLYYKIDKAGTGENAKAGQKVTVNYTGKTMDGKPFDSNVDPAFQHVQPFSFNLGQGQVIRGWDEGVQLLKKGSKGTLYIPSTLAYGAQGTGPIKPNAVLIFDIEVTDIEANAKN